MDLEVPQEILDAARKVKLWAEERGYKDWSVLGLGPVRAKKHSYDERLREVSLATVDAQIWGCGFLMLLPDNSFQHIPHDRIVVQTKEQPDSASEQPK